MLFLESTRDQLLQPLLAASGVVEKRQTKPILANVLLERDAGRLGLIATDGEMQLAVHVDASALPGETGRLTVNAKKLLDILRSLSEGAVIRLERDGESRLVLRCGRSRFTLQALPAEEFPRLAPPEGEDVPMRLTQRELRRLIALTSYAMAQQDIRYYLVGMLFVAEGDRLDVVTTDSHRLAHCAQPLTEPLASAREAIVPRKAVGELQRLLTDSDDTVEVRIADKQIVFRFKDTEFLSKIIDGRFPDFRRVIPQGNPIRVSFVRTELQQALQRVAILASDKIRPVKLSFSPGLVRLSSHNAEQEEAVEEIEIAYDGEPLEIGFNVGYLLDVLGALTNEVVHLSLKDGNAAALITVPEDEGFEYVVMPMRL